MGFLGFGGRKPSRQEERVVKDIEELETFLGEVEHWFFKLRRLKEQLQYLQSHRNTVKGIKGKAGRELARQLEDAIAKVEGKIAEEARRKERGEIKRERDTIRDEKAERAEEEWLQQKQKGLLAEIESTKDLTDRTIIDSVARRIPLVFLDVAKEILLRDKSNNHQYGVALDAANLILNDIYRFYFPRTSRRGSPEEIEKKVEAESPDPSDNVEMKRAKEITFGLLSEINNTKEICRREIIDSVARRLPVGFLDVAEIALKNARTTEGHNAAQHVADTIIRTIYRYYFPRIGRHG